jgi:hypothetical protein
MNILHAVYVIEIQTIAHFMVRIKILFIVNSILLSGCLSKKSVESPTDMEKDVKAQGIVDNALATHGGEKYTNSRISFIFRDQRFLIEQDQINFHYQREFTKEGEAVKDVYENGEFYREINGNKVTLSGDDKDDAISTINSVPYFALLPYKLNDPAVIKEYVGEVSIKGEPYHKIRVTFQQEGGGKDHDNVFYYWFHKENATMDYFGYTKDGNRFREANNIRVVNGIRFADYVNYKSTALIEPDLEDYDILYEDSELTELSKIELEDIIVEEILVSDKD